MSTETTPTTDTPDAAPAWVADLMDALRDAMSIPADCRCLSREQAAAALGVSVRKLDAMASSGDGPPSMSIDSRRLYPAVGLRRWISERLQTG